MQNRNLIAHYLEKIFCGISLKNRVSLGRTMEGYSVPSWWLGLSIPGDQATEYHPRNSCFKKFIQPIPAIHGPTYGSLMPSRIKQTNEFSINVEDKINYPQISIYNLPKLISFIKSFFSTDFFLVFFLLFLYFIIIILL